MTKADKTASARKSDLGLAAHPSFSFNPIIDHLIQTLNRLWSRLSFAHNDKIPHCSGKWRGTQPTHDKN